MGLVVPVCLFADVCKPRFIVMHDTNTRKNARVVEHLLSVDEGGWERLDGGTALRTSSTGVSTQSTRAARRGRIGACAINSKAGDSAAKIGNRKGEEDNHGCATPRTAVATHTQSLFRMRHSMIPMEV